MGDKVFVLETVNHSTSSNKPIILKFYYPTYQEAHDNLVEKIVEAKQRGYNLLKKDSFISEFACRLDSKESNYVEYRISRHFFEYE